MGWVKDCIQEGRFGQEVQIRSIDRVPQRQLHDARGRFRARLVRLVEIPVGIAARVVDGTIGVLASLISIPMGGKDVMLQNMSRSGLNSLGDTVAATFYSTVRIVNPYARIDFHQTQGRGGLLAGAALNSLERLGQSLAQSRSPLKRHLFSRLAYAAMIPVSVITRVIDFAIGFFASIVSIATLGIHEKVNTVAYRGLQGGRVVADIVDALHGVVNPHGRTISHRNLSL